MYNGLSRYQLCNNVCYTKRTIDGSDRYKKNADSFQFDHICNSIDSIIVSIHIHVHAFLQYLINKSILSKQ